MNIYRESTELLVDGVVLYSEEGTTQGDPLVVPMCALAHGAVRLVRFLLDHFFRSMINKKLSLKA